MIQNAATSLAAEKVQRKPIGEDLPETVEEKVIHKPLSKEVYENEQAAIIELTNQSELGFAEYFVQMYKGKIHYDCNIGKWFYWNGSTWTLDHIGHVRGLVMTFCRRFSNGGEKKQTRSFIDNVQSLSKSIDGTSVTSEQWDSDPMLLGLPTGYLNLSTGQMMPPDPKKYITKCALVDPDFTNEPKLWLRFLAEITRNDEELIEYLQRRVGYSLTGNVNEHDLVFVYGPGGNGKSVFIDIVYLLLNAYADIAAMSTFVSSKNEQHPADLAKLAGARLVVANETESNRSWAESKIKSMTGGDPITARFMRQDFFTYKPQFKIWIVGNYKPNLKNIDEAMRRRLRVIPFLFKPEKKDVNLKDKLVKELPSILAWAVKGCIKWQSEGMNIPASVQAQTDAYFEEQDIFSQFIEDKCIIRDGAFVATSDLFDSWSLYAKSSGVHPESKKAMADKLEKRYFTKNRLYGQRGWSGLELKPNEEREDWTHAY